jgi:hypothetical protein
MEGMMSEPSQANLIWQSGFRARPRFRRRAARIAWSVLAALGMRHRGMVPSLRA